jgi:hypothetical protein
MVVRLACKRHGSPSRFATADAANSCHRSPSGSIGVAPFGKSLGSSGNLSFSPTCSRSLAAGSQSRRSSCAACEQARARSRGGRRALCYEDPRLSRVSGVSERASSSSRPAANSPTAMSIISNTDSCMCQRSGSVARDRCSIRRSCRRAILGSTAWSRQPFLDAGGAPREPASATRRFSSYLEGQDAMTRAPLLRRRPRPAQTRKNTFSVPGELAAVGDSLVGQAARLISTWTWTSIGPRPMRGSQTV